MITPRQHAPFRRYSPIISLIAGIAIFSTACGSEKKLVKHNRKYMEHTYKSIQEALPGVQVGMKSDTVTVIFNNAILFDFNKADINPKSFTTFEHFAEVLNKYKKTEILIAGHTDSIGGDNMNNRELSARRADSAANMLQYYKVDAGRIEKWGMGAHEPVASNATDEGRALNRRVEFHILYDYKRKKSLGK